MTHETTQPDDVRPGELAPEDVSVLARAILRGARRAPDDPPASEREVRDLLARLCAAARAGGLRAEQLLVVLKAAWYDLPETRRMSREDSRAALARVVTLCIDEYYSPLSGL